MNKNRVKPNNKEEDLNKKNRNEQRKPSQKDGELNNEKNEYM